MAHEQLDSTLDNEVLRLLRSWDEPWTLAYQDVLNDAFLDDALSLKERHLVMVGLAAAITSRDRGALERHVDAALNAGASRAEVLEVLKMASILALHSMTLGAQTLIEETATRGASSPAGTPRPRPATPAIDKMKAIGQWNSTWEPFESLDPGWTEAFIRAGTGFYTSGVFKPKFVELISIAFDASITHMFAPGVKRHVRGALGLGATPAEIMAVLKLCVAYGASALNQGVPVLDAAERAAASQSVH